MTRISAILATSFLCATAAFAQTNLPQGQSLCTLGYEKAKNDARLKSSANSEAFKKADKDNNGTLSKAEFDAACTARLFREQDNKVN